MNNHWNLDIKSLIDFFEPISADTAGAWNTKKIQLHNVEYIWYQ